MNKKISIVTKAGIAGVVISGIGLIYFWSKYGDAEGMLSASRGLSSEKIWEGYVSNYIIGMVVMGIIALISVILIIYGLGITERLVNSDLKNTNGKSDDISEQLKKLQNLHESNLITQEEYEKKREEIINNI